MYIWRKETQTSNAFTQILAHELIDIDNEQALLEN